MSADPVAFLVAEFGRVEQLARAAGGGEIEAVGYLWETKYLNVRQPDGGVSHTTEFSAELADHFALHSPASVLRRVTAGRELLADLLAERHLVVDGDCWYTCAAATEDRDGGETCDDDRRGGPCDCGRDARVERRVRLLAEGYGWVAS